MLALELKNEEIAAGRDEEKAVDTAPEEEENETEGREIWGSLCRC